MKSTFLLLTTIFFCLCANAQPHSGSGREAAKTTAVKERLVGYSYRLMNSSVAYDTVYYFYSGNNGSDSVDYRLPLIPQIYTPNHQTIKCDSYVYKAGTYRHGIYTYNTAGNCNSYTYADTIGGGGSLVTKRHYFYHYDGANRISDDSINTTSPANYKDYYTYDASGYLIEDSVYDFLGVAPVNKFVYTNNAGGAVTDQVTYAWSSGSWNPNRHVFYTYDSYGHMTTMTTQTYSGSGWVNYQKDSFYFPGASNKHTLLVYADWTAGSWVPSGVYGFHVNAADHWDTLYQYGWDIATLALDTFQKEYYTYDAYGNLKYTGAINYLSGTGAYEDTAVDLNTYYYETYNDGLTVNDPASTVAGPTVNIFPNPVSNTLHITLLGLSVHSKAKITVTNTAGLQILNDEISEGNNEIDIAALRYGIYIVSVTGDGIFYRQKIVKCE